MNEPKNTDFFPQIDEQDKTLVAPEIYRSFVDSEEDLLHEKRLNEIEAQIDEKFGVSTDADLGELPYDAEADRKRWDELEKDFDRVFEEAEKSHS
ncbi:hypothetical protein BH20ACI1_BH20ACI1_19420 [soil metagenome]